MKTLLLATVFICICTVFAESQINPSNYIWINYGAQIQVSQKNSNEYITSLPCQARIGSCSYNFKLLPLNWKVDKSGSLLIPKADAEKDGVFAIQVQLSDKTGQKLQANLVAKISNKMLSVTDQGDFYKQNGYDKKEEKIIYNPNNSNYQQSPLAKQEPEGFPSLNDIESVIASGNVFKLSRTLNQIKSKYAPCRSLRKYMQSIQRLISQYIYLNLNRINQYNDQVQILQDKVKNLTMEKQIQSRNPEYKNQIQKIQTQIDQKSKQIETLSFQQVKYRVLANSTLNQFKNVNQNYNSQGDLDIQKTIKSWEQNIKKVDKWLQNAFDNKMILRRAIEEAKLKAVLKNIPNSAQNKNKIEQIQSKYRISANNEVINQIKYLQADIKLTQEKQNIAGQTNQLNMIDAKIQQLNNRQLNSNKNSNTVELISLKKQNEFLSQKLADLQKYLINGDCKI